MTLSNVLNRVINLSRVLPCKTSGSSTVADFSSADPRGLLSNNLDTMAKIKHFASLLNFEIFSSAFVGWFFLKLLISSSMANPRSNFRALIKLLSLDKSISFKVYGLALKESKTMISNNWYINNVLQVIVHERDHWFVCLISL